ncbi:hypothetical protein AB0G85_37060 [Streptomyces sioyaensis]|uniref:hypothetical protein n=1 Tax=Streptomyces sioyaensis TaxID=67364 RepID=UPI0033D6D9DC
MYEMRVGPATSGTNEVTWHVMAKADDADTTLCGRRVITTRHSLADPNAVPERYCAPCLTAFRATFETAD